MIRTTRLLALAVGLGLLASAGFAAEFRTWSDASGKFTVKAKFVAAADGKVTLEQEDGSTIEVELAKLSPADQKYVADQKAAADSPFKKKPAETPFQPKSKAKSRSKPAAPTSTPGDPPLTPVDWSAVRVIDVNPESATWKLSPATAAA